MGGKNMGQKTQVFYQKNYNYVKGMPTTRKGLSPLQLGDIWVTLTRCHIQQSVWKTNGLSVIMQTNHQQWCCIWSLLLRRHDADAKCKFVHAPNPYQNIFLVDYSTYNVKKYTNGAWEWAWLNTDGSGIW